MHMEETLYFILKRAKWRLKENQIILLKYRNLLQFSWYWEECYASFFFWSFIRWHLKLTEVNSYIQANWKQLTSSENTIKIPISFQHPQQRFFKIKAPFSGTIGKYKKAGMEIAALLIITYHGSNSWIMLSKRITAKRRLAKPTSHAKDRMVKVRRDCHPIVCAFASLELIFLSFVPDASLTSTSILEWRPRFAAWPISGYQLWK